MIEALMAGASVVGLGWALAWWDVRRRQSASVRAAEMLALRNEVAAVRATVTADGETRDEVIRSLAKEFGSMKMAVGLSPGRQARGIRERFAEAAANEKE